MGGQLHWNDRAEPTAAWNTRIANLLLVPGGSEVALVKFMFPILLTCGTSNGWWQRKEDRKIEKAALATVSWIPTLGTCASHRQGTSQVPEGYCGTQTLLHSDMGHGTPKLTSFCPGIWWACTTQQSSTADWPASLARSKAFIWDYWAFSAS